MTRILGIDPGAKGAIGVLDGGEYRIVNLDYGNARTVLRNLTVDVDVVAYLEDGWWSGKDFRESIVKLDRHRYRIAGMLEAWEVRHYLVQPSAMQRRFGIAETGDYDLNKAAAYEAATRFLGKVTVGRLTRRGADGLLYAELGRLLEAERVEPSADAPTLNAARLLRAAKRTTTKAEQDAGFEQLLRERSQLARRRGLRAS